MPYASGRMNCDADSYIMESLDWPPPYADGAIRDRRIGTRLDGGLKRRRKTGPVLAPLSAPPSDHMRRAGRVTPFANADSKDWLYRRSFDGIFIAA